jgi:hypothetical protein
VSQSCVQDRVGSLATVWQSLQTSAGVYPSPFPPLTSPLSFLRTHLLSSFNRSANIRRIRIPFPIRTPLVSPSLAPLLKANDPGKLARQASPKAHLSCHPSWAESVGRKSYIELVVQILFLCLLPWPVGQTVSTRSWCCQCLALETGAEPIEGSVGGMRSIRTEIVCSPAV